MSVAASDEVGAALARLRAEVNATQAAVAEAAGVDQSRISRIEKGEISTPNEIERVLDALAKLGSKDIDSFKAFSMRDWTYVQPPSFWNPQRACIEIAEDTLSKIDSFMHDSDHPWPLKRQLEKHHDSLRRAATYLTQLNHNIAFIGDLGVGKSTAISFIFDLLLPAVLTGKTLSRPVLETGAGGTTICEVHIKRGPEFGVSLLPVSEPELHQLVADLCSAKWIAAAKSPQGQREASDGIGVSREVERALRNMAGLVRSRQTVGGKVVYHDPLIDLAKACATEEELRTKLMGRLQIEGRSRLALWYDSSTRKHPMEWLAETFKAVNNGRIADVPMPKSIDLLVPEFGKTFGSLEISIVDTKGVDDVAIRQDLDLRLKDPRSAVVLCSRFNDAPGVTARSLMQHMRQTFSERVDTGKVAILALPRSDEARAMKHDGGEQAETDAEGYDLRQMQVSGELSADELSGVPILFFNVEADDPGAVREQLFNQLNRMRKEVEGRLFDLCAAAEEIIENHEAQALTAAMEEVANRLNNFLAGNRDLAVQAQPIHADVIRTIHSVRYAATLWAATRRNGEYSGLSMVHQVGVGAARDARLRSDAWFYALEAFLKSLEADAGLNLAAKSISQISASATASRRAFLDSVQQAGMEVYREHLAKAAVWTQCESEWGQGPGFKVRVANHVNAWFASRKDLSTGLEGVVKRLWEETVVGPLLRLTKEETPAELATPANVVAFPAREPASHSQRA